MKTQGPVSPKFSSSIHFFLRSHLERPESGKARTVFPTVIEAVIRAGLEDADEEVECETEAPRTHQHRHRYLPPVIRLTHKTVF
jgi:hypothetical protein